MTLPRDTRFNPYNYQTGSVWPNDNAVIAQGFNATASAAACSVFTLLQAILGLRRSIDPLLPEWLPDLTLLDLRVGRHRFDVRFWREGWGDAI